MADLNEQSFSAGTTQDNAVLRAVKPKRSRAPAPLWRFSPGLQPSNVVRSIKKRIIPKVVLALLSTTKHPEPAKPETLDRIAQFAALALGEQDDAAMAFVRDMMASGASVDAIFLDLLAPTARHLGELWETDATDFANVTLGVSRLQTIMRQLSEAFFDQGNNRAESGESALLTVIPGEQHSFGLSMVAEFFRRAGWNLCTGPVSSHKELTSLVHNHWFDVVGFSVSSDRRLEELKTDIREVRRASRNRNVGIMLGGPMLIRYPDLVASLGADMMSLDAVTAPQQARNLIAQMRQ